MERIIPRCKVILKPNRIILGVFVAIVILLLYGFYSYMFAGADSLPPLHSFLKLIIPPAFSLMGPFGIIAMVVVVYMLTCIGFHAMKTAYKKNRIVFAMLLVLAVVLVGLDRPITHLLQVAVGHLTPAHYVEFFNEHPAEVQMMFEREVCFGGCPAYYFIIFGDGEAYLLNKYPSYNVSKGLVQKEDIISLLNEFERRRYFNYNDEYSSSVTDRNSVSTALKIGNEQKLVWDYGGMGPHSLETLEKKIDSVKERTELTPVNLTEEVCDKMYSNNFFFLGSNSSQWNKEFCYYLLNETKECLRWYEESEGRGERYDLQAMECPRNLGLASLYLNNTYG